MTHLKAKMHKCNGKVAFMHLCFVVKFGKVRIIAQFAKLAYFLQFNEFAGWPAV